MQGVLERAVRFLVEMQSASGAWLDFDLEVGLSDAWVTAYVGTALAETEDLVGERERRYVTRALDDACAFLWCAQRDGGTWSFNANVDPDSDSTSWAASLLRRRGAAVNAETYRALASFRRADGGFATYNAAGGGAGGGAHSWTASHPDVTPVVARTLADAPAFAAVAQGAASSIAARRREDGGWNSFWYRTPLYATLHNLAALESLAQPLPPAPERLVAEALRDDDPFEGALAVQIASRYAPSLRELARQRVRALAETQSADGCWSAAAMLRVTDPSVAEPWAFAGDAAGPLYRDEYCTFTTATVATALAGVLRRDPIGPDHG